MKITKKTLKDLILKELNDLASTQNIPVQILTDIEAGPLNNYADTFRQKVERMHQIINKNEFDDRILRDFKKNVLGDLFAALGYLESAVDASLRKTNEDI